MNSAERRKPMTPPPREVPPAVVQVVVEFRVLLQEIRTAYSLDRRGKDTPNGRVRA